MEIIQIVGVLAVCCLISFIAMHFWVFICDCLIGGIKRLFGFNKKKTINWHTLDKKEEKKTDVESKETETHVNERFY